jgi:bis(5'-nucleosyl)-tetraphosphatase (symmetrical)
VRWIVGDLQGCVRELEDLLAAIDFDASRDHLWATGDLINRGPDSLATVRLWRELGGRGVIGNHEVYALCARSGRWPRKNDTLDELYTAPDAEELLASLRALPALAFLPAAESGRDVWLVHAGVHPQWHDLHAIATELESREHDDDWLNSDEVAFATRVRCCTAAGERSRFARKPEDCPPPHRPWDEFYEGDALIVHGHWAWRGHYRGERTIGLDSGCVYGGKLTAYCVEEDRVVQVPSRQT